MHNINKCLERLFSDLDKENREVCVYGLELILLTAGDFIVLILSAIIMGKLLEGVLFLVVYSSIRSQAGGYHADSKIGCLGIFLIIFVMSLSLTDYIHDIPAAAYALICIVVIAIVSGLAPVEAVGVPILEMKRKIMKKRALIIMSLCMAGSCILYIQDNRYYIYMLLAMVWNCAVLIAGKVKLNLRRN